MRLDPVVRDYRSFMDEFIQVLESNTTRYYLDTSVLMWLMRLGETARSEFMVWCAQRPAESVRVPVWVAHELHRHVTEGTVRNNIQKTVREAQAKYDEFVRLASERADDPTCRSKGYAGRPGYISQLEYSFARVRQLASVVDPDEKALHAAVDEVITFANNHVLATDLTPIVTTLSATGEFRYSHRIPPGFHDNKDENKFGDVVIWEELVMDMTAASVNSDEARHAVLISRDRKTDWVSGAHSVTEAGRHAKANRDEDYDVVLARPLLVHEFGLRTQSGRLYITNPSFLATALTYADRAAGRPSGVTTWLAASHRPDLLSRLHTSPTPVPLSPAPSWPLDEPESLAARCPIDLSALTITAVMDHSIAPEVRAYLQALPPERSSLVDGWVKALQHGSVPPAKLGRILAELSDDLTSGITDYLPRLLGEMRENIDASRLNVVVLTVIASAYFDRHAQLRRLPNLRLGATVLSLEPDETFDAAFTRLREFLGSASATLPYIPGSARSPIPYTLDLPQQVPSGAKRMIHGIRIGHHSAFAHPLSAESPRRLNVLLQRQPADGCSGLELRSLLAREYIIPLDFLASDHDKKILTWPANAGLARLDAETEGGFSALLDEEIDGE